MATITLATYTIRVRTRFKKGDYDLLSAIGGDTAFLDVCNDFLRFASREHVKQADIQHLQRARNIQKDGDSIWGIINAGEYGYSAEGWDSETMKPSYRRKPADAEMIPFYFHIHAPVDSTHAILICQRFGPHSIYGGLRRALKEYFAQALPGNLLEFGRLVPRAVMEALLTGRLTSIKISTYDVPHDLTDQFRLGGNFRDEGRAVITFKAKRGSFLQAPEWISRWIRGATPLAELPEGYNNDPAVTKIHLGYKFHGRTRQINMLDLDAIAPYYDVTDEIKVGPGGHPIFASIHAQAMDLREELRDQLGME